MKKEDIKRSRLSCILISCVFVGFIAFFSIGTLVSKDREFSQMENRPLEQKPKLTRETLFSGEFGSKFEDYMSDQVLLKDTMMSVKTACDYGTGRTLQNGVYFSGGGYLLQRYTENADQLDKNAVMISDFAAKTDIPVDLILSPNSVCLNADKLPAAAVSDDQSASISRLSSRLSGVTLYDATDLLIELQESGTQAFYRTDHHWTSPAARAVCEDWLKSAGLGELNADYEYAAVPDFYGTLYSKAPAGFIRPDEFGYYVNKNGSYSVEYVFENRTADTFIDESFLDKKDKYASLFGGNFALMKLTSNATGGKLLVLKDSYANAMLPLLADKFSEIWVMDLRYCKMITASSVIEENGIDRVLMIYNLDFLNEDDNFVWLD